MFIRILRILRLKTSLSTASPTLSALRYVTGAPIQYVGSGYLAPVS